MNFTCPHCNGLIDVPPEQMGQTIECPMCNGTMSMPPAQETAAAPPASAGGQQTPTCGLAIGSLVCGILSLLCVPLIGIGAVVCGHIAMSKIKKSAGELQGNGMAIAGLVTGYLGIIFMIVFVAIMSSAFFMAKDQSQSIICINNLRQIEMAKDQAAMKNNRPIGEMVTKDEVSEHIMNGFDSMTCPEGGTYTINPVGEKPSCSIHGYSYDNDGF
jgi:hypothetical protein